MNESIEEVRLIGVSNGWRVVAFDSKGEYALEPVEFIDRDKAIDFWKSLDDEAEPRQ